MKIVGFGYALGISVAAALFAGCGGSQPPVAPSAPVQPGALTRSQTPLGMTSDTRRFAPRLWYIANFYDSTIDIYTIPGLQFKGTLTGAVEPQGMCTTGKKTFWVVNSGADDMLEYEYRGTSPIKKLTESIGEPAGCSIDPTTGDVAASILFNNDVLVWKDATGSPTVYTTPFLETYSMGYDGSGDLFAAGSFTSGFKQSQLFELAKGSDTFKAVIVVPPQSSLGSIQWDGTYLAIGISGGIGQFVCSEFTCTQKGFTPLKGALACGQGWIDKGIFACGDIGDDEGKLWHYPAGGAPFAHTPGSPLDGPIGTVIVK